MCLPRSSLVVAYAYANGAIFSSFVKMEASFESKSIFIYLRQQIQLVLVWQQGNSLCWFGWIHKSVESFIKLKLKLKLLYFCCSCQLIQSNWKFLGFFNPLNRLHPIRWSLESNGSLSILKWKIRLKNSWAYIWAYWNDPGFLPIFSDAWFESSKNKPAASFPSLFPVISLLNGLCVCWFQKKRKETIRKCNQAVLKCTYLYIKWYGVWRAHVCVCVGFNGYAQSLYHAKVTLS